MQNFGLYLGLQKQWWRRWSQVCAINRILKVFCRFVAKCTFLFLAEVGFPFRGSQGCSAEAWTTSSKSHRDTQRSGTWKDWGVNSSEIAKHDLNLAASTCTTLQGGEPNEKEEARREGRRADQPMISKIQIGNGIGTPFGFVRFERFKYKMVLHLHHSEAQRPSSCFEIFLKCFNCSASSF